MTEPRDREIISDTTRSVSVASQLAQRTLAERGARANDPGAAEGRRRPTTRESESGPDAFDRTRRGWWVRVDQLGLPEPNIEALEAGFDPPNLIIVGGSLTDASGVAETIARFRQVSLRSLGSAITPADLAAVSTALEPGDVLFLESLDRMSDDALEVVADILPVQSSSGEPTAHGVRTLNVWVGTEARHLVLNLAPFLLVARTTCDKIPENMTSWGAQHVIAWSTKLCPRCAEEIKAAAAICRYCGYDFGT